MIQQLLNDRYRTIRVLGAGSFGGTSDRIPALYAYFQTDYKYQLEYEGCARSGN